MKITAGIIVFNTKSILPTNMLELCIKNIHDLVDEIIIVEGATEQKSPFADGNIKPFTSDGKSNDGTIEDLQRIEKKFYKVRVIYSNGFWGGKTEMCNEYSKIATGDYIWQIDSDEFYKEEDVIKIKQLLEDEKPDAVYFYANHFYGDFNHYLDEKDTNWSNGIPWMRIFRNIPNKSYWLSHEPPQYICDGLECKNGNVVNRDRTLEMGIKMYHYSFVQESQFKFKSVYYRNENYIQFWNDFQNGKRNVFGSIVSNFDGEHPDIIKNNYL